VELADDEVELLLLDVLRLKGKYNHSAVISAIISAYQFTDLDPLLSYRAFKVTNDKHLLNIDIETLPLRLFLTNRLSPKVFGQIIGQLSPAHTAAAAQFFLSNFEEARFLLLECPPSSPLLVRMQEITHHYNNQELVLDPIGRNVEAHWLASLIQANSSGKPDFSAIESTCTVYLQRH
jgi:hypothetical protein